MAANLIIPSTLTATQPQDATGFMADVRAILDWMNANGVHLDGSKATSAPLVSNGVDPGSANVYSRKAYVDSKLATELAAKNAGDIAVPKYGCSVSRVAAQSCTINTLTSISFDTETYDTNGFFAPTSTNITIPTGGAGIYLIDTWGVQTAGEVAIYLNGAYLYCGGFVSSTQAHSTALAVLAVGDVITFRYFNNSATVNVTAALTLQRVSL